MERKTCYLILILLAYSGLLQLQASNSADIFNAYQSGDMTKWKAVIDRMERQTPAEPLVKLELLNYYYGYIGYTLSEKQKTKARSLIRSAYVYLEALEKQNYKPADLNAYRAAFYGYEIALNKLRAPYLGPKSIDAAKKALELDQNNPMALTQYGNILSYMPVLFGGSKQSGLEYYQKALRIYEIDLSRAKTDWNYLNLLITITMAHVQLKQEKEAMECYQKIQQIAPEMQWAKEALNLQNSKSIIYEQ